MVAELSPARLRLSRAKGFDLQAHSRVANGLACVAVARPSRWGNPFTIEHAIECGAATHSNVRAVVVNAFRIWLEGGWRAVAVWQGPVADARRATLLAVVPSLRGRNLACWCALDQPCHADVLLELANR